MQEEAHCGTLEVADEVKTGARNIIADQLRA